MDLMPTYVRNCSGYIPGGDSRHERPSAVLTSTLRRASATLCAAEGWTRQRRASATRPARQRAVSLPGGRYARTLSAMSGASCCAKCSAAAPKP